MGTIFIKNICILETKWCGTLVMLDFGYKIVKVQFINLYIIPSCQSLKLTKIAWNTMNKKMLKS
jgi:hypothetical protein